MTNQSKSQKEDGDHSDIKFICWNNFPKNEEESQEDPDERFVESSVTFQQKSSPDKFLQATINNNFQEDRVEFLNDEPKILEKVNEYPIKSENKSIRNNNTHLTSYENSYQEENKEKAPENYINYTKSTLPSLVSSKNQVSSICKVQEVSKEESKDEEIEDETFSISNDSVKKVNVRTQGIAPRKSLNTLGTSYLTNPQVIFLARF